MAAITPDAPPKTRRRHPTEPHDRARSMVQAHVSAITERFRILETALRQPYARTLTEAERAQIAAFLTDRIVRVENLLAAAHDDAPAFRWHSPGT